MDPIDEIKQLYYKATAQSIESDFARAIDLLKSLPDEDARARAAVYMEGLAEMRRDWQDAAGPKGRRQKSRKPERPRKPEQPRQAQQPEQPGNTEKFQAQRPPEARKKAQT